jgi:hypothetical protein
MYEGYIYSICKINGNFFVSKGINDNNNKNLLFFKYKDGDIEIEEKILIIFEILIHYLKRKKIIINYFV